MRGLVVNFVVGVVSVVKRADNDSVLLAVLVGESNEKALLSADDLCLEMHNVFLNSMLGLRREL